MKILNIACLFILTPVYLVGQDYKPYKKDNSSNQANYQEYSKQTETGKNFQGNSADGFFDNYVNQYNGDPNVEIMKKNDQINAEKKKLLLEKEAILISLDSIENANLKAEEKLFDLKTKVESKKMNNANYKGYQNSSSNNTNNQRSQNNTPSSPNTYSKVKDNNSNIIYEYERKVVRRGTN